jgi:CheY-like chemotaxis protein
MNAVMGMTSLILDQNLPAETIDCVNTIRSSSDALLTIINDILDFSKIESGKLDLESEPFSLHECIEEVLELLANRAAEKKIELAAEISPVVAEWVLGDITRTRQILLNLVGNAVKFTQYGEVVVMAQLHPAPDGDTLLYLGVRDTGIGIPKDKIDALFQSFSQVDASTTRRFGGTGLGLAISKRLTELMGGKIWVTSEADLGSVFQLEIPYRPVAMPAKAASALPDWSAKQVLVVDDNETNRVGLVSYLSAWKIAAQSVGGPKEALEAIRERRWDAVLIDSHMPEMDGAQLAMVVNREFVSDTPPMVLLSSGFAGKENSPKGTNLFAAIVAKPVRRRALQRALDQVLSGVASNQAVPSAKIFDNQFAKRAPLRILLAEDNPVNQKVAIRMLERLGYRVDAVGNGLEVLDAVRRQTYDIVLMDVQMPEMNGLDATRRIIETWRDGRPWITALTAGAMKENRDECIEAGVDDFLTKPINVKELEQALQRCFEKQKAHGGSNAAVSEVEVEA